MFEAFVQLTAVGMRRSICDAFFCRPIDNSLGPWVTLAIYCLAFRSSDVIAWLFAFSARWKMESQPTVICPNSFIDERIRLNLMSFDSTDVISQDVPLTSRLIWKGNEFKSSQKLDEIYI